MNDTDSTRKWFCAECTALLGIRQGDQVNIRFKQEVNLTARGELIARSKTGRSSARRRLPESDEDFRARLTGKYRDPAMFHREMLYISRDDTLRTQREVWELGQQLLTARRRGFWTPNRHACFQLGNRPCAYWALCRSGDSPIVRENHYAIRPPHEELAGETDQPF